MVVSILGVTKSLNSFKITVQSFRNSTIFLYEWVTESFKLTDLFNRTNAIKNISHDYFCESKKPFTQIICSQKIINLRMKQTNLWPSNWIIQSPDSFKTLNKKRTFLYCESLNHSLLLFNQKHWFIQEWFRWLFMSE